MVLQFSIHVTLAINPSPSPGPGPGPVPVPVPSPGPGPGPEVWGQFVSQFITTFMKMYVS